MLIQKSSDYTISSILSGGEGEKTHWEMFSTKSRLVASCRGIGFLQIAVRRLFVP